MKKIIDRIYIFLPYLTIAIIIVCSFLSAYGMSFLGDDLNHGLRTREKFPLWYQLPLAIPYQWLTGNGRFGDMIGNILLAAAPMWLLATLSALFEGLLYFMVMKLSFPSKNSVIPRLMSAAIVMFTFPWWDSFFLFVCRINYVWTAALTLFVFWIALFRHNRNIRPRWCWLLLAAAFVAGWGHEAVGIPLVAGLTVYFLFTHSFKALPKVNRFVIIAYCMGSLLSITSPCSYSRLGGGFEGDDIMPVLILKSSFLVLALLLMVLAVCLNQRGRRILMALLHTPWTVFAVGSVASLLFVAVGGVVGRSGFFSQTYALISIGILSRHLLGESYQRFRNAGCRIASLLLFAIMAAHEAGVCHYQITGNKELKECKNLFMQSQDGIIYASPIQRNQFPWWTLNKNKACIDNDDFWLIETYDNRLGKDRKHYRLLPAYLRNFSMGNSKIRKVPSGYVTTFRPEGTADNNIIYISGEQFTVVDFKSDDGKTLYYVSPRITDPGDR